MALDIVTVFVLSIVIVVISALILKSYLKHIHNKGPMLVLNAKDKSASDREWIVMGAIELMKEQLDSRWTFLTKTGRGIMHMNIGLGYYILFKDRHDPVRLEHATGAFQKAQSLIDKTKDPIIHSAILVARGKLYKEAAEGGDQENYLKLALNDFEALLALSTGGKPINELYNVQGEIAFCHTALSAILKSRRHSDAAARAVQKWISSSSPDANFVAHQGGHLMLAANYLARYEFDRDKKNLELALESCTRAIEGVDKLRERAAREAKDRDEGEQAVLGLKIDNQELKLRYMFSTIHMRLAELEERKEHLDQAMASMETASKLFWVQKLEEPYESVEKEKAAIERMKRGETYEEATSERKASDGGSGLPSKTLDLPGMG